MKKISVIIPAHNEEKYIYTTLEYLKKSNITQFEIIVVCDSCTDKTKEIALQYTEFVYEVDFQNISKTRNFGAEKSSGEAFVFLDADTIVSENYLDEITKSLEVYDYGCAKTISEHKGLLSRYIAWGNNNYYKKNIGGNFFVKKEIFYKVGGFDESMKRGEDTDLGERLKNIGVQRIFLDNCYIIPSERRYKKNGYIYFIIETGIRGFMYKFFRKYYNNKIASKFYE